MIVGSARAYSTAARGHAAHPGQVVNGGEAAVFGSGFHDFGGEFFADAVQFLKLSFIRGVDVHLVRERRGRRKQRRDEDEGAKGTHGHRVS